MERIRSNARGIARAVATTVMVFALTSCAAALSDVAIGTRLFAGGRIGSLAEYAAGSRLLSSRAIAGQTFGGFGIGARSPAVGGNAGRLFVTEELAGSRAFQGALSEIAGQTGVRLVRDAGGFLRVGTTPIGVTTGGYLMYPNRTVLGPSPVALIRDGYLWAVTRAGQPVKTLGVVRGIANRPSVSLRASPSTGASVVRTLRPGTQVQVLRMQDGWFEIAFSDGMAGWVESPLLLLILAAAVAADSAVSGIPPR